MSVFHEKSADSDSFSLKSAELDDIPEVEKLVNLAYRGGLSSVAWKNEHHLVKGPRIVREDLCKYIQSEESKILLLRTVGGALVGTVHLEKHGDEVFIGMLAVHPEYQNLGLGKRLLGSAADVARDRFLCRTAKMFVFGGRNELLDWYRKMGYESTGETLPFFGPEAGLTALVEDPHFVVVSKALL